MPHYLKTNGKKQDWIHPKLADRQIDKQTVR